MKDTDWSEKWTSHSSIVGGMDCFSCLASSVSEFDGKHKKIHWQPVVRGIRKKRQNREKDRKSERKGKIKENRNFPHLATSNWSNGVGRREGERRGGKRKIKEGNRRRRSVGSSMYVELSLAVNAYNQCVGALYMHGRTPQSSNDNWTLFSLEVENMVPSCVKWDTVLARQLDRNIRRLFHTSLALKSSGIKKKRKITNFFQLSEFK